MTDLKHSQFGFQTAYGNASVDVTLGPVLEGTTALPYSIVLTIREYCREGCHCCTSGGVPSMDSSSLRVLGVSSRVWISVNSSSVILIVLRTLHRHGFIPNLFQIVSCTVADPTTISFRSLSRWIVTLHRGLLSIVYDIENAL